MWYRTLKTFIESDKRKLEVGWRNNSWIESFKKDLERWQLPVSLCVTNEFGIGKKRLVFIAKDS